MNLFRYALRNFEWRISLLKGNTEKYRLRTPYPDVDIA
jgi:hypothetical protein